MKCEKHASRPDLLTAPCARYFDFEEELFGFFISVFEIAKRADGIYKGIVTSVRDETTDAREKRRYEEILANLQPEQVRILRFQGLMGETTLVRSTDNFLSYISELLALIFTTRPETLKSSETVKLEEIIEYGSMEDLIKRLAERRVERLSYQGMDELQRDLHDKLGFDLFPSPDQMRKAVRIIEMRNLIVHNRGVVNSRFRSKTGDSGLNLGERLEVKRSFVDDTDLLAKSVVDIDQRAATKFALPRVNVRMPRPEIQRDDSASHP